MIKVEQGPEYRGETYIWCDKCAPSFSPQKYLWLSVDEYVGVAIPNNLDELLAFLVIHSHE